MLDAVLGSVDEEEALRIVEAFALPRQIDIAVFVERSGDGDQLIARFDGESTQGVEAWPRAVTVELALVLAPFRAEDERLLSADDVHKQLAHAARCGGESRV